MTAIPDMQGILWQYFGGFLIKKNANAAVYQI